MSRTARASVANYRYHILNRGNNRARVFHEEDDFAAFADLLTEAKLRHPMRILAYCLMSNPGAAFHALGQWRPGRYRFSGVKGEGSSSSWSLKRLSEGLVSSWTYQHKYFSDWVGF